ncbi:MAG: hypothetical protein ACM3H8_11985 [Sphingobacteriales bacterium]
MVYKIQNAETDKPVKLFIGVFFIIMLMLSFLFSGTGDEGDSVMHYLMARHAFGRPAFFFDQWAKPVYVMLAAPFAQLGFWGVKLMNILLACGSIWFTYKTAKNLVVPFPWMAAVIFVFIPMNISLILSGLTEPLFAFVLIWGIYKLVNDEYYRGLTLLSFLPFVRSEGLIVLCVLLVYLIIKEQYQLIPILATGHVVYSLLGYFVHKDFLWVFNNMSYATWSSAYGSGKWTHFISKLPEIAGKAGAIFTFIGIFWGLILLIKWFRKKITLTEEKELFLVYGIFVTFFIGHSAFWALGIFNSMGLLRVMVGAMPLFAIVILQGMHFVIAPLQQFSINRYILYFLFGVMVIYPFSNDVFALHWERDLVLKADQYADRELAVFVKRNYPDYKKYEFYYEPCYLSVVLNQNYFNEKEHKRLLNAFENSQFADKCFIIWDDWFAIQEGRITLEKIEQDSRFEKIKVFQQKNYWGTIRTTILFRKK